MKKKRFKLKIKIIVSRFRRSGREESISIILECEMEDGCE